MLKHGDDVVDNSATDADDGNSGQVAKPKRYDQHVTAPIGIPFSPLKDTRAQRGRRNESGNDSTESTPVGSPVSEISYTHSHANYTNINDNSSSSYYDSEYGNSNSHSSSNHTYDSTTDEDNDSVYSDAMSDVDDHHSLSSNNNNHNNNTHNHHTLTRCLLQLHTELQQLQQMVENSQQKISSLESQIQSVGPVADRGNILQLIEKLQEHEKQLKIREQVYSDRVDRLSRAVLEIGNSAHVSTNQHNNSNALSSKSHRAQQLLSPSHLRLQRLLRILLVIVWPLISYHIWQWVKWCWVQFVSPSSGRLKPTGGSRAWSRAESAVVSTAPAATTKSLRVTPLLLATSALPPLSIVAVKFASLFRRLLDKKWVKQQLFIILRQTNNKPGKTNKCKD